MAAIPLTQDETYGIPEEIRVHPSFASLLLRKLALGADSSVEDVFDRVFLPLAIWYARHRAASLAKRILRRTQQHDIFIPGVPAADLDDVVADAAHEGLRRARASAADYDPQKGDPVLWVMAKVALTYVNVVRKRFRRGTLQFPVTDDFDALLDEIPDAQRPSPEITAELATVLAQLPDRERHALVLFERFGMSYAEIAVELFGDLKQAKRVEHLLSEARSRLRDLVEGHGSKRRHH